MGSPLAFVDKLIDGARRPLGEALLERAEDGIILRLLHRSRGDPTVPVPGRSISQRMTAGLKCDTIFRWRIEFFPFRSATGPA